MKLSISTLTDFISANKLATLVVIVFLILIAVVLFSGEDSAIRQWIDESLQSPGRPGRTTEMEQLPSE